MSGDRDVERQQGSQQGGCCHWWSPETMGGAAGCSREGPVLSTPACREEDDESVLLRLLELQDRRGAVAASGASHQCRGAWARRGAAKGKRRSRDSCRHLLLLSLLSKSGDAGAKSEPGPSTCRGQAAAQVDASPPEKPVPPDYPLELESIPELLSNQELFAVPEESFTELPRMSSPQLLACASETVARPPQVDPKLSKERKGSHGDVPASRPTCHTQGWMAAHDGRLSPSSSASLPPTTARSLPASPSMASKPRDSGSRSPTSKPPHGDDGTSQ